MTARTALLVAAVALVGVVAYLIVEWAYDVAAGIAGRL